MYFACLDGNFTSVFMFGQYLQLELNDLRSKVDHLRDSALELKGRTDQYQSLVEPELTDLNRRWEAVAQRLKVGVLTGVHAQVSELTGTDVCIG